MDINTIRKFDLVIATRQLSLIPLRQLCIAATIASNGGKHVADNVDEIE